MSKRFVDCDFLIHYCSWFPARINFTYLRNNVALRNTPFGTSPSILAAGQQHILAAISNISRHCHQLAVNFCSSRKT